MADASQFLQLLPGHLHESVQDIRGYLEAIARMKHDFVHKSHPEWKYTSVEALLLDLGREFVRVPPEEWPADLDLRPGEMKACFMNASRDSLHRPGLTYCEGYATSVIPMNHAWVTTDGRNAIDTTWHTEARLNPDYPGLERGGYDSSGAAYFGIAFTDTFCMEWQRKTGYYGIFGSEITQHVPDLLKDGLPEGAIAY